MRFLLLTGLGLACGAEPDPPPLPPDATVELGRMEESFAPLADGVDLELIPGAQGGFHVEIALWVDGFDPSLTVEVLRDTRRDDTGDLVATTSFHSEIGEDGILSRAVPVFLCPAPVGISVADQPLEVRVKVSSDAVGEAAVAFVPRCPSGDQADFCDRICRR